MNRIEWFEQLLDKEEKRLFIACQILENNPLSYSAKVAIQSAERSIGELKNNLQNERKETHLSVTQAPECTKIRG